MVVTRNLILVLILLTRALDYWDYSSAVALTSSQSACPTIAVDCPDDVWSKSVVVFKAKITGGKIADATLTYKWSVTGGEIKEGQGTPNITITNFNLKKQSLTVGLEVGGVPENCSARASCSISD